MSIHHSPQTLLHWDTSADLWFNDCLWKNSTDFFCVIYCQTAEMCCIAHGEWHPYCSDRIYLGKGWITFACRSGVILAHSSRQICSRLFRLPCSTPVHCNFQVVPQILSWIEFRTLIGPLWDTFFFLCHRDVHLALCLETLTFQRKNFLGNFVSLAD